MEIFDIIWKGFLWYVSSMGFTTAYLIYQDSRKPKNWRELFIMTSPYAWFNMKKYKKIKKIDIDNDMFYEYDKPRERTKKRLQRIIDMDMEEVGFGQFGVPNVMSGLYIEKVWSYSNEDFDDYLNWAQFLIDEKTVT